MSSPFTFADARRIVREHLLDHWTAANGRLHIADHGFESPTHWRVLAESHPIEADEDSEPVASDPLPDTAYLVSKDTGALETVELTSDNVERLSFMTPYGSSDRE